MKRHKIPCRNDDGCEWKSCDFLHTHKKDSIEINDLNTIKSNPKQQDSTFKAQIKGHKDIAIELMDKVKTTENTLKHMTDNVEAIEEKIASKLEEQEKALYKLIKCTEKNIAMLQQKIHILESLVKNLVQPEDNSKGRVKKKTIESVIMIIPGRRGGGRGW